MGLQLLNILLTGFLWFKVVNFSIIYHTITEPPSENYPLIAYAIATHQETRKLLLKFLIPSSNSVGLS